MKKFNGLALDESQIKKTLNPFSYKEDIASGNWEILTCLRKSKANLLLTDLERTWNMDKSETTLFSIFEANGKVRDMGI